MEVASKLIEHTTMMKRQTSKRLICVMTDNESEFCDNKFDGFCLKHDFLHLTSAPSAKNIAYRANRSIDEMESAVIYYLLTLGS
ncbi:hypothetical protein PsorP6_016530 [Peronosclerospora sorghi]|uniref:Uncharacterized protein n=1 Tax=Peronosclerospora sorghi TaxID=230839 RepID=A0ACC0VM20_9STRA|nr:hypothetical protein PsorP6_016530 [Peronosclerospora sorghi]